MAKYYYNQHLSRMCKGIKTYKDDTSYPQHVDPCKLGVNNCESTRYGCTVRHCRAQKAQKQVKSQERKGTP